MVFEERFLVGIQDVDKNDLITNKALFEAFGNLGCIHSNFAGSGPYQIRQIHRTWVVINWKLEVFKRPKFFEHYYVRTWSRSYDRLYAYRDFEVYNEENEKIAICTSRWVWIDTEQRRLAKLEPDMMAAYQPEDHEVFPGYEFPKIEQPENIINQSYYDINSMMIDFNNHVHNTTYLDLAKEVIPAEVLDNPIDNIEIIYKKEIKLGDRVKIQYSEDNGKKMVTIKSENELLQHGQIIF